MSINEIPGQSVMGLGSHSLALPYGEGGQVTASSWGDTAGKGGPSLGYLPHCCPNSKTRWVECLTQVSISFVVCWVQCIDVSHEPQLHSCTPAMQPGHQFPLPALSHQLLSVSPPNGILLEDCCLAEFWVPGGCKE